MNKTNDDIECEACESIPYQWILKDSYPELVSANYPEYSGEYRVCGNCLIFLVNRSLTTRQFFKLIGNGHSIKEFLLHEDFYDKSGNALQPSL